MGGGQSGKFSYDTIGGTTLSYDGHDPASAHASPLAWSCYMRPDGAPDANGADRACSGNTGPSNCGEVSAFSVVAALGVPTTSSIGSGSVTVNLRDHGPDLGTYLACRSKAGCTGDDIVAGARIISGGQVVGCFFGLGPASAEAQALPPEALVDALAAWLACGAVGVATLNLQALGRGADAWHHQFIWGAGAPDRSGVLVANGIGSMPARDMKTMLETDRVLMIRRDDVEERLATAQAETATALFAEERWAALDVAGQVAALAANPDAEVVRIPASYSAGISLYARA